MPSGDSHGFIFAQANPHQVTERWETPVHEGRGFSRHVIYKAFIFHSNFFNA